MLEAVLFDLDGVITATSELHYLAWKQIADDLDIQIDREFNETLKGVDRRTSLMRILQRGNLDKCEKEIEHLMKVKNRLYVDSLKYLTCDDVLPGITELLKELNENNIKVSIASASRNAPYILEQLELINFINYIANPANVKQNKPAPDIFLLAAKGVNADIKNCVAIEDAVEGVKAINASGAKSISVGIRDSTADLALKTTTELNLLLLKTLV